MSRPESATHAECRHETVDSQLNENGLEAFLVEISRL